MVCSPSLPAPRGATTSSAVRLPSLRLPSVVAHHAVASAAEIDAVLAVDPDPARLTHVATPRSPAATAAAARRGVARFAVGAEVDLRVLTRHAPGALVLVRLTAEGRTTAGEPAASLLARALARGHRVGVRLRLGERRLDLASWQEALRAVSRVRWLLECDDQDLSAVDLGRVPGDAVLARGITRALDLHLGPALPTVLQESTLSHRRAGARLVERP